MGGFEEEAATRLVVYEREHTRSAGDGSAYRAIQAVAVP